MKLNDLFQNFNFIEKDCFGNFHINLKKFFISVLISLLFVTFIFGIIFLILHICPPTDVYYDTMNSNETQFVFNFKDSGKDANQYVENVYLSCDELNIHEKEIYANDGNNFSYYVDVPKNISHFKLVARFEGEFPYISQRIVVDVNKV